MSKQTISQLLDWQWQGYTQFHASKLNLLIHIVCVPLFLWGNIGLIASVFKAQWTGAAAAFIIMGVAFGLQGIGHKAESQAAVPFSSVGNAVTRIFLEQWVTFPKFVISGAWLKALRSV